MGLRDRWSDEYDEEHSRLRIVIFVTVAVVVVAGLIAGVALLRRAANDGEATAEQAGITSVDRTPESSAFATTVEPTSSTDDTNDTIADVTSAGDPGATTSAEPPTSGAVGQTYITLPDGQAAPVVALIDSETIALTGVVPSQAAADRLEFVMASFSDGSFEVTNNLTIDENVPLGVGVHLIQLGTAQFASGSSIILPDYSANLDRVVQVMKGAPNASLLVVAHSDQSEADADNLAVSDARASAVVGYLVLAGIEPKRLSSRAVGSTDLLTTDGAPESLAQNRRTEFIFSGLLISE